MSPGMLRRDISRRFIIIIITFFSIIVFSIITTTEIQQLALDMHLDMHAT